MDQFGTLMFTPAVQAEQDRMGTREMNARLAERPAPPALSQREADFVEARTSFYLASVASSGWPYVQHRGGPAGFLRVAGPASLVFADYGGNRRNDPEPHCHFCFRPSQCFEVMMNWSGNKNFPAKIFF